MRVDAPLASWVKSWQSHWLTSLYCMLISARLCVVNTRFVLSREGEMSLPLCFLWLATLFLHGDCQVGKGKMPSHALLSSALGSTHLANESFCLISTASHHIRSPQIPSSYSQVDLVPPSRLTRFPHRLAHPSVWPDAPVIEVIATGLPTHSQSPFMHSIQCLSILHTKTNETRPLSPH